MPGDISVLYHLKTCPEQPEYSLDMEPSQFSYPTNIPEVVLHSSNCHDAISLPRSVTAINLNFRRIQCHTFTQSLPYYISKWEVFNSRFRYKTVFEQLDMDNNWNSFIYQSVFQLKTGRYDKEPRNTKQQKTGSKSGPNSSQTVDTEQS